MMFPKNKHRRIKSTTALNDEIHQRDKHCCIACGSWVNPGEKWHHWPFGIEKEDVKEKGVLLCYACHGLAHSGDVRRLAIICCRYLSKLYPNMREYYERHTKGGDAVG